jgi:hypothetical protein
VSSAIGEISKCEEVKVVDAVHVGCDYETITQLQISCEAVAVVVVVVSNCGGCEQLWWLGVGIRELLEEEVEPRRLLSVIAGKF